MMTIFILSGVLGLQEVTALADKSLVDGKNRTHHAGGYSPFNELLTEAKGLPSVEKLAERPHQAAALNYSPLSLHRPNMTEPEKTHTRALSTTFDYGGSTYRLMTDNVAVNAPYSGAYCHTTVSPGIAMPPGTWEVAPFSQDIVDNVVTPNTWGVHVVCLANKECYGSASYTAGCFGCPAGNRWENSYTTGAATYRCTSSCFGILIRVSSQTTAPTPMPNPAPSPAPSSKPSTG